MLSRAFVSGSRGPFKSMLRLTQANPLGLVNKQAHFSSDQAAADTPAAAEPTQAEKDAHKQEWGIKYDDECLKFEKEWEVIAKKVQDEQMIYLESELSDLQKKKVDMIADKVLDMNIFEMRYFDSLLASKIHKSSGINPMKLNLDWPSLK